MYYQCVTRHVYARVSGQRDLLAPGEMWSAGVEILFSEAAKIQTIDLNRHQVSKMVHKQGMLKAFAGLQESILEETTWLCQKGDVQCMEGVFQ